MKLYLLKQRNQIVTTCFINICLYATKSNSWDILWTLKVKIYRLVQKSCPPPLPRNENNKRTSNRVIQSTCTGFSLFTIIDVVPHLEGLYKHHFRGTKRCDTMSFIIFYKAVLCWLWSFNLWVFWYRSCETLSLIIPYTALK